jgi:hypothetical protein
LNIPAGTQTISDLLDAQVVEDCASPSTVNNATQPDKTAATAAAATTCLPLVFRMAMLLGLNPVFIR